MNISSASPGSAPIVLVTACLRPADGYFWHAATHHYVDAVLHGAEAIPVILPAVGERVDVDALLDHVDGVLVTGSRSNVHPSHYGEAAHEKAEPYDRDRDATTLPLIRHAVAAGVPLLAICRGMQELNVAFGGTLHSEIHQGGHRIDHRAPEADDNDIRFAIRHTVTLTPNGRLIGILRVPAIETNSLHRQAVARLGNGLIIEARAEDGTVEALSVADAAGFALGVQWHPEYWFATDAPSRALFAAFGQALRDRLRRRVPLRLAAE